MNQHGFYHAICCRPFSPSGLRRNVSLGMLFLLCASTAHAQYAHPTSIQSSNWSRQQQQQLNVQSSRDQSNRVSADNHARRLRETGSSSGSGGYGSGGGGASWDFGRFSIYGSHFIALSSDLDAIDLRGGGFLVQIDGFACSIDLLVGEVEKADIVYDDWSYSLALDFYLFSPPFIGLLDEGAYEGLSLGAGLGLYTNYFSSKNWDDGTIDEVGISLSAIASYRLYLGEVGLRGKWFIGSDLGVVGQVTYGLCF